MQDSDEIILQDSDEINGRLLGEYIDSILYCDFVPDSQTWASRKRKLSRSESAMPGFYNSDAVPYLKDISIACESGLYEMVIIVMGSQMSKTEFLLNRAGFVLSREPVPIAITFPTQSLVKRFSKKRLDKMIQSVPEFKKTYDKEKSTLTDKYFMGGSIRLIWCTSAAELSSDPLKEAYIDELDRCPVDVGGEGDPVSLLRARGATFPDFLLVASSTPTIEGASPIVDWWEKGTKFKFHWKCPFCNKEFVPHSSYLKWPKNDPLKAILECPLCSSSIQEMHKKDLNQNGVYRSEFSDEQIDKMIIGSYWVSGLCSPWRSFGKRAEELHTALKSKDENKIKAVFNTSFGETYLLKGDAPDFVNVLSCKDNYTLKNIDVLKNKIHYVLATVDIQETRLYYVIRGWGDDFNSWLLAYGEFYGNTSSMEVFSKFEEEILGNEKHPKFYAGKPVSSVLFDSGFRDHVVYDFCRLSPQRYQPVRGCKLDRPIKNSKIEYGIKNYPVRLWMINDTFFKEMVYNFIRTEKSLKKWFLPEDITEDYIKSVTAEELVIDSNGVKKWILRRKRNDFLDCEKYMLALTYILGFHISIKPNNETEPRERRVLSKGI